MQQQQQQQKICNMDRFSSLPDEIAHRILQFVSTKEISRLSVVSKRCGQLCLSTPFFYIDDLSVRKNPAKRAQLMNYVDRVLFRRIFRDIPVFIFNWYKLSDEQQEYRFLSWIHKAVLCDNVRQLHLTVAKLRHGLDMTLPSSSILSCTSLEILELRFQRGQGIAIFKILPADLGRFSSLKSLALQSVRIDSSLFDWISRCCNCLSSLNLNSTEGTNDIRITSSSLYDLSISYPYTIINLEVHAENLEVLNLVFLTTSGASQAPEPKLTTPKCRIMHKIVVKKRLMNDFVKLIELGCPAFDDVYKRPNNMHLVLHEFASTVAVLEMFGDTVEDMYKQRLPTINMPNLKLLKLVMNRPSNVDHVSLMASILKGTPQLRLLSIKFHYNNEGGDIELVRRGQPEMKSFWTPKLKRVQIVFKFGVQRSKLELINYFVNSACEQIHVLSCLKVPLDVLAQITAYEKCSSSQAKVHVVCLEGHYKPNINQ